MSQSTPILTTRYRCPDCKGYGRPEPLFSGTPCSRCSGTGTITERRSGNERRAQDRRHLTPTITTSHACAPPPMPVGVSIIEQRPDWTCAVCARVWRHIISAVGINWWAEIQGPRP